MGTFSRFRHVVSANVNALLEKAEDPDKMLKALVREMEDAMTEAREAASTLIAEEKTLSRRVGALREKQDEWADRAEQAVKKEREDLARQALAHKAAAAEEQAASEISLEQARTGIQQVNRDIERLEKRLDEARRKQAEWQKTEPTRQPESRYESPADRQLNSVMGRFERLEAQMDHLEARVESYDIGRTGVRDWPQGLDAVEADEKVEAELAELKSRLGAKAESAKT
jgi:phage shock protein A